MTGFHLLQQFISHEVGKSEDTNSGGMMVSLSRKRAHFLMPQICYFIDLHLTSTSNDVTCSRLCTTPSRATEILYMTFKHTLMCKIGGVLL